MSRRSKSPPSVASKAYLVSFGDTMTALLAFFIVLNSLSVEQSGANLYEGTGSFVRALSSFGLPGLFSGELSRQPFQNAGSSPHYLVPPEREDFEPERDPSGPDNVEQQDRVIDYEFEAYQRFLHELDRLHETHPEPELLGEVAFDRMNAVPRQPPRLDQGFKEMLGPIAPLLRQRHYTVELVVWATTPNPTAWSRAAEQADELRAEIVQYLSLPDAQSGRLTAVGRPWISSTEKRPFASIIVRRVQPVEEAP